MHTTLIVLHLFHLLRRLFRWRQIVPVEKLFERPDWTIRFERRCLRWAAYAANYGNLSDQVSQNFMLSRLQVVVCGWWAIPATFLSECNQALSHKTRQDLELREFFGPLGLLIRRSSFVWLLLASGLCWNSRRLRRWRWKIVRCCSCSILLLQVGRRMKLCTLRALLSGRRLCNTHQILINSSRILLCPCRSLLSISFVLVGSFLISRLALSVIRLLFIRFLRLSLLDFSVAKCLLLWSWSVAGLREILLSLAVLGGMSLLIRVVCLHVSSRVLSRRRLGGDSLCSRAIRKMYEELKIYLLWVQFDFASFLKIEPCSKTIN